ncbi:MAG: hypothetical protein GWN30_19290 [Gammaproteobacteria bacterium]|nr:hypothetical protein [Gammaproteobacteria bacterium]
MNYIPIFSTIITIIFMFAVFYRFLQRRKIHLLLWSIGLLFYGLGTLMEAVLAFNFSTIALKIWYFSGAMLTAAWLGQGTFHLLIRKGKIANLFTVFISVISIIAIVLIILAPVTTAASTYDVTLPASEQYKDILTRDGAIIGLTIFLNLYGTVFLVGGAIYSAYLFWRKQVLLNRVIGNVLIAGGALLPATAGAFVKAGLVDWLYLSEFLGVILMYTGFIQATTKKESARVSEPATTD